MSKSKNTLTHVEALIEKNAQIQSTINDFTNHGTPFQKFKEQLQNVVYSFIHFPQIPLTLL